MSEPATGAGSKLASSRQAILQYVNRNERRQEKAGHDVVEGLKASVGMSDELSFGDNWFGTIRRAVGIWWRHHPAHMAVEIATPMLSSYGRRQPVLFLGIAAAAGALVIATRPWKLVSATGLVMALLKSSQLSGLVMSAMSAADFQKDDQLPYRDM